MYVYIYIYMCMYIYITNIYIYIYIIHVIHLSTRQTISPGGRNGIDDAAMEKTTPDG